MFFERITKELEGDKLKAMFFPLVAVNKWFWITLKKFVQKKQYCKYWC